MKRILAIALVLTPAVSGAQRVVVRAPAGGHGAALVDSITTGDHVVRSGTGPLVFPRDSTITSSLLVLGRPTYVAGTVRGDVVVVGNDLFLRPGAAISGRAVAIGGTVAETSLGHVSGTVQSLRDESFVVERDPATNGFVLTATSLRVEGAAPGVIRLPGIRGLMLPSYDRVDGLSMPVGVQFVLDSERILLAPTITYRSRLGVFDPGIAVRLGAEEGTRFEGRAARDTRTNDAWITPDLINSLKTFAFGTDTRNYFRADVGEGRIFRPFVGDRSSLEPFVGARFERVSPITSSGNVYSILERDDSDKVKRPNPLVEPGHIGSALAGLRYRSLPEDAPVTTRLELEAEQSVTTPPGTRNFTQLTADGAVEFPTILTHRLRIHAHAVGTLSDSTPRARYAYLGGSRTLGLSRLLEFGGDQLVFVDSRYLIPIESVQLPVVGALAVSLIHRIGGAGVHGLGTLQQEVGAGLSLGGIIDLEVITGASGQRATQFGVGVSMPAF